MQAGGVGSYDQGAYYPAQSFMHVMKSLRRKVKQQPGCRALLSTEITRIEVADGKASSVTTAKGEQFTADHFLFDGDARLSLDLIGAEHFPGRFPEETGLRVRYERAERLPRTRKHRSATIWFW